MSNHALHIAGLSLSESKGQPHTVVDSLTATPAGIEGDRHAGPGLRQVSIMHEAALRGRFDAEDDGTLAGSGHENILLAGGKLNHLRVLDTLEMGDAILEVTRIGSSVAEDGQDLCETGQRCLVSDHGVFARVVHGGIIEKGAAVRHQQRLLHAYIITVSDRASQGHYDDESGPAIEALLEDWCVEHGWGLWAEFQILPDDQEALATMLQNARQSRVDLVITAGGTGIGPRDNTPDVVANHADKIIPGIMDHIRMKYGQKMPLALTSRSIAAVLGNGLVYTLPGSPKAVPEYLHEIFKTLEHLLLVLKGIDAHR